MRAMLAAMALIGLQGCVYYVYVPPKGKVDCHPHDRDCEDSPRWDDDDDDWDDEEDEFCEDLEERLDDCLDDRESRDECDELEELYEDYCEDDWDDDDDDREEDEEEDWEDDDREDEEDEEARYAELQEGLWVLELTGPEKGGDCDDVVLAGIDYLQLSGELERLGEREYVLETEFSLHYLFVERTSFFGEGIIEYDGVSAGSYLEGEILSENELRGIALGSAYGCQISADLWATSE